MKKQIFLAAFLVATLLSNAGVASAISLYGNDATVDTEVKTNVDVNGTTVDVDTSVDAGATTTLENDEAGTATSGAAIGAAAMLSLSRDDVEDESDQTQILSATEVTSDTQLRSFASTVIRSDVNVEKMEFSEEEVEVTYKQKGHVIGLIPVTINVTAQTNTEGEVEVKYPWYFLVMLKNKQNLEVELANEVRTVTAMMSEEKFNAKTQAEIAARMYSVLKTNFDASVEAESEE